MKYNLEKYYRLHARFYDATRWSFLFGRTQIIRKAAQIATPKRILEIGCGTGKNLLVLHRIFPRAMIEGIDLSLDMLNIARKKTASAGRFIQLSHRMYDASLSQSANRNPFDLLLFSYSLSMFNPGFEDVLKYAAADLCSQALIAVVDFNDSRFPWFQRWMSVNNVRMDHQLIPVLRKTFTPLICDVKHAYLGLWTFFYFLGRKK
ncbi:MAG TPA: class I SAM-dependent methyltransferase [Desulfobacterales bacterium]